MTMKDETCEWFRMSYCEMLMLFKNRVMCLYVIVIVIFDDHDELHIAS